MKQMADDIDTDDTDAGDTDTDDTDASDADGECPQDWIADGMCDAECNNAENQYDGGDCDGISEEEEEGGGCSSAKPGLMPLFILLGILGLMRRRVRCVWES